MDYYSSQVELILRLARKKYGGDEDSAEWDYVQNHSERFAKEWREHPELRDTIVNDYEKKYMV